MAFAEFVSDVIWATKVIVTEEPGVTVLPGYIAALWLLCMMVGQARVHAPSSFDPSDHLPRTFTNSHPHPLTHPPPPQFPPTPALQRSLYPEDGGR